MPDIPWRLVASLLWLLPTGAVSAGEAQLPRDNPVPGGIAIVALTGINAETPPVARYNGNRVMVRKSGNGWLAVVGIPLETTPGAQEITLEQAAPARQFSFTVANKDYETQHLTIKNKRQVNPNEADLRRINQENAELNAAFAAWQDTTEAPGLFRLPVQGRLGSPFGLRRFFNDEARKPHSGLDLTAKQGTPISAPAAGKVVIVGDYFFNGNTVMIDHGQGLVSMYCHLNSITVKKGAQVHAGQRLGTVGKTGRATGPHLHWSVSLNNARVDPTLFLSEETLAHLQ